jgi:fatty acid desaturase
MSPEPAPTTARVPRTTGRWSEYTQLSRQIKQAGLLDRRRGWYLARIGLNLALLAGGWVAFAMLGASWWQLLIAVYLAVVFTQLAFIGHDAGHRQLFRSRRANDQVGLIHANLLVGVSFEWWVAKHNRHHTNPNHQDLDPDISITALAFTSDQATAKQGLVRLIARPQAFLFFPLLLLEAAHLHLASTKAILRGSGRANTVEGLLLVAHVAGYVTALGWCCHRCRRWCSWWSTRGCSACTWAARSPQTTRACPPSATPTSSTSCAARCRPPATWPAAGWSTGGWAG